MIFVFPQIFVFDISGPGRPGSIHLQIVSAGRR